MIYGPECNKYFNQVCRIWTKRERGDSEDYEPDLTGRVINFSPQSLVVKVRGNSRSLDWSSVERIELAYVGRQRSILIRYFADGETTSIRQHLADRHGLSISVLNRITEDAAREVHDGIDHGDLGHRHGDRPRRGAVSQDDAIREMERLDAAR